MFNPVYDEVMCRLEAAELEPPEVKYSRHKCAYCKERLTVAEIEDGDCYKITAGDCAGDIVHEDCLMPYLKDMYEIYCTGGEDV